MSYIPNLLVSSEKYYFEMLIRNPLDVSMKTKNRVIKLVSKIKIYRELTHT